MSSNHLVHRRTGPPVVSRCGKAAGTPAPGARLGRRTVARRKRANRGVRVADLYARNVRQCVRNYVLRGSVRNALRWGNFIAVASPSRSGKRNDDKIENSWKGRREKLENRQHGEIKSSVINAMLLDSRSKR
eukprot:2577758-Pyramimonas_sp.AAC.1